MPEKLESTLLTLLAENVPHRIYAKDVEGRFIYANQPVADGMGVATPREVVGRTDFAFFDRAAAEQFRADELQVMQDRPLLNHEERAENLKDGDQTWVMTTKLPLRDAEGAVIGVIGINYDISPLKRAQAQLHAASTTAQATARALEETVGRLHEEMAERRRFEAELQRRVLHDDLTGLPNRASLMERLDAAIAEVRDGHPPLTLLFIDLDGFKQVNDTLGHAVGDELLQGIAQRIAEEQREGDMLARLGGDEFVVLLRGCDSPSLTQSRIQQIAAAVARPFTFAGQTVSVTCSIGSAGCPHDAGDATTLLQHADAEMYRAKQRARRIVHRVPASRGDAASAEDPREIAAQLHHALRREEFRLHYQPQLDLRSGRIVGVEALIRWQHPEWGMVAPLRFIPVAEECGEIGAIGEWVLQTACAQAMAWQRAGLAPLRMSVNLSAQQFMDRALPAQVDAALADSGLAAQCLELELTESASMCDPQASVRILGRFRERGIGLAIDDFGTGYSNLAYLIRFPVDRIKLDRSFISGMTDLADYQTLVETVIGMAHRLRLEIVAEGVETPGQVDILQALRCDSIQGYWLSRPLEAAGCERFLQDFELPKVIASRP